MIRGACKLLALTAVSSVLGYCVYFDNKRRSDPDYKKKVRARRLKAKLAKDQDRQQEAVAQEGSMPQLQHTQAQALRGLVKTNTEQYFLEQVLLGENRIMSGDIDGGIVHMINATSVCTRQEAFLQMLQGTLPPDIFQVFLVRLQHAEPTRSITTNGILPNAMSPSSGGINRL
ncbi:mitochondrial import receptor subunit TOM20 homolog [Drosophila pseudoobscura]|uniref:Mitochondrial import receptor subunit TOM20 homolog n=1 Tax=Drosophila pseudoobscura pseudoobscura TaxID=46245 RepID=A0A6I8V3W0_DROPS|nr:mitochondrial import receptor subunit TOM20 homolog [Drosophila pseudoobscura]